MTSNSAPHPAIFRGAWFPILDFLPEVLRQLGPGRPSICDIGCGQGELVAALRFDGFHASGFDPVLREPSEHLYADFWTPEHSAGDADLLVMRCVLPHIPEPWSFLAGLATRRRHVLVEYQRIEWLIENGVWYGLNHDHVNYFTSADWEQNSSVVASGMFAEGEWGWVLLLLDPDATRTGDVSDESADESSSLSEAAIYRSIQELDLKRRETATALRTGQVDVVLWGAAGKGVVAADALIELGVSVQAAVDADPDKWGTFLECSGVEVWSPGRLADELDDGINVIICVVNPRHMSDVEVWLANTGVKDTRFMSLAT